MNKEVDNFYAIRQSLKFENIGDFYFLEIIQRKKDGCNVIGSSHNSKRTIRDFYITSQDNLVERKDEIINLCRQYGARAYIRLNKRNYKTISLAFAEEMLNKLRTGNAFKNPLYEMASVVGRYHDAGKDKTWIVDIDDVGADVRSPKVRAMIDVISRCEPLDVNKVILALPTKTGVHLITRPFNKSRFNELLRKEMNGEYLEIKVDNPTLLYCP